MDATCSVSKGVFVFKNGFKPKVDKNKNEENEHEYYKSEDWYQSYRELWETIEDKIEVFNKNLYSNIMHNLLEYVGKCYINPVTEIPAATLLMGVNMSDNALQLRILSHEIVENVSPHVAILHSEDCNNIKSFIENMVSQFVNTNIELDCDSEVTTIKKSLCTMWYLEAWYKHMYRAERGTDATNRTLVVIIPEFESFNADVLQNFILIASSYINVLPFVVIFGVATSVAIIHTVLPYQASSKLNMQVFSAYSSTEYLNNILNNILLTDSCYFHLNGQTFSLFTDIFLFYDLSVKGFLQNFKYVMLQHFSSGAEKALCTSEINAEHLLSKFEHGDFEKIRRMLSFRKFVEDADFVTRIKLLENDKHFCKVLREQISQFRIYFKTFLSLLKCLLVLVSGLPKSPLGVQYREIYAVAMTENIASSRDYEKCLSLLKFLSKEVFASRIKKMIAVLDECPKTEALRSFRKELRKISEKLENVTDLASPEKYVVPAVTKTTTRTELKSEILKMCTESKQQSEYEKFRDRTLSKLTSFFKEHLVVPTKKPFHELFIFCDVKSVKDSIMGQYRSAVHTALNNPRIYLECACCQLPTEGSISRTLPDICIVYKLHLECGKLINLYDLLQAFVAIVEGPSETEETEESMDPKLRARFTRAIAELEFLGFVKSSRRKVDHIQRLTWGAS